MDQELSVWENRRSVARDTKKQLSLPVPLARLVDDGYRSGVCEGFIPRSWTPPAELPAAILKQLSLAVKDFEEALEPATPEQMRVLLSRLAMSCRLEDLPEKVWEVHLSDFIRELEGVPLDILNDACSWWRKTQKFWPTISDLYSLITPRWQARQSALRRLKVLERVAESPAPGGTVTKEWHDKVMHLTPKPARGLAHISAHVRY